jgi:hypothetical protein
MSSKISQKGFGKYLKGRKHTSFICLPFIKKEKIPPLIILVEWKDKSE